MKRIDKVVKKKKWNLAIKYIKDQAQYNICGGRLVGSRQGLPKCPCTRPPACRAFMDDVMVMTLSFQGTKGILSALEKMAT